MTRKIIFVDETAKLGGAEINLLTFITALQRRGWQPAVILPHPGPFAQRLREAGVAVHYVPRPRLISTTFDFRHRYHIPNPLGFLVSLISVIVWTVRLRRFLSGQRPDVVHTISMWAHASAGVAARLARIPVAWHFQDIVRPGAGWGLYGRLVRLAARFIPHRIICISEQVAAQFKDVPIADERVSLLWNTIDTARFSAPARDNGHAADALRIGTVARLMPWKGHQVALEVARQLKDAGVSFCWTFAGDATLGHEGYYRHLRQLVRRYDLSSEVQFVGWIDDMPDFYGSLDVLVHLPTEPEPFGLVLAEAMSAGVPLICSRGGADPLVQQGGGELVSSGSVDPVVDLLSCWARRPPEVSERSQKARNFAEETFSLDAYANRLTAIYDELLMAENR